MASTKGAQIFRPIYRRVLPIAAIIIVFVIIFGLYFAFGITAEENVRNTLLQQYEQRQIDQTEILSNSVASDIDSIVSRLQLLASKPVVQRGELSGEKVTMMLKTFDADIKKISANDGISLLDRNNALANTSTEEALLHTRLVAAQV